MNQVERVTELVLPLLAPLDLELYDVEVNGGVVKITIDAEGGVLLDTVAAATRAISHEFDEVDPISGAYTLEVSSPGLERRLRTPEHFAQAVGEVIAIKLSPHVDGDRRYRGELVAATDNIISIVGEDSDDTVDAPRVIDMADITKANTVFEWGPAPKPGKGTKKAKSPTTDSERRAAAK